MKNILLQSKSNFSNGTNFFGFVPLAITEKYCLALYEYNICNYEQIC